LTCFIIWDLRILIILIIIRGGSAPPVPCATRPTLVCGGLRFRSDVWPAGPPRDCPCSIFGGSSRRAGSGRATDFREFHPEHGKRPRPGHLEVKISNGPAIRSPQFQIVRSEHLAHPPAHPGGPAPAVSPASGRGTRAGTSVFHISLTLCHICSFLCPSVARCCHMLACCVMYCHKLMIQAGVGVPSEVPD